MDEGLRNELLLRFEKQRNMVKKASQVSDASLWDFELGKADTVFLKRVVKKVGWPTISLVGKDGAQAAWQLLQHSDDDLSFQAHCLELMKQLPSGEIMLRNIAYMEDRVRKGQGKPQLYGTQYAKADGKAVDIKIEDVENLDKRRLSMGLKPFTTEQ
jgi:hypothetical protein